jgi:hypothetical protein
LKEVNELNERDAVSNWGRYEKQINSGTRNKLQRWKKQPWEKWERYDKQLEEIREATEKEAIFNKKRW